MRETAALFGETKSLVGIVTDPGPTPSGRPTILLLNAGLLHRVGPHRVYVRIARRLAAAGFPVLRFDFSSIGDSEARRDELSIDESVLREGREAMDFLAATRRAERFVLMGLCAGAENAFRIARQDPRVVGAAMIDGYAYRTAGYYVRYLSRRLFSTRSWQHLLTGNSEWRTGLRMLMASQRLADGDGAGSALPRVFPPKNAFLADLRTMIGRGVELQIIYTGGGMEEYYNYDSQFDHAFPSLDTQGRVRVAFYPEADHLFTRLGHQAALISAIEEWVLAAFAPRTGAATTGRPSSAAEAAG